MTLPTKQSPLALLILGFTLCGHTLCPEAQAQGQRADFDRDMAALRSKLEASRGLKFRVPTPVSVKSRAELKQAVLADLKAQFNSDQAKNHHAALKALGLVPQDMKVSEVLLKFYSNQIGGYYNTDSKRLVFVKGPKGAAMSPRFVIAHEMTHALQDQHFDLSFLMADSADNNDRKQAGLALIEGDATLAAFQLLKSEKPQWRGLSLRKFLDQSRKQAKKAKSKAPKLEVKTAKIPRYFLSTARFSYDQGGAFVEAVVKARGLKGLNQLFLNPPQSTEQILHPKKYLSDRPDQPWLLHTKNYAQALGQDYSLIEHNSLGEFGLSLLLQGHGLDAEESREACQGWGGDRYQVLRHEPSKRQIVVLISHWDSARAATGFRQALSQGLKAKKQLATALVSQKQARLVVIKGATTKENIRLEAWGHSCSMSRASGRLRPALAAKPPLSVFEDALRSKPAPADSGRVITDDETRVSFRLPTKGWNKVAENIGALRQFSRSRFLSKDKNEELRFLEVPMEYDEKNIARRLKGLARQGVKKYKKHEQKPTKVQGRNAYQVEVSGIIPLPGYKSDKVSRVIFLAIDYGETTLLFLFRGQPEAWKAHKQHYQNMVQSVVLGRSEVPEMVQKGRRVESENTLVSIIAPKGSEKQKVSRTSNVLTIAQDDLLISVDHLANPLKRSSFLFGQSTERWLRRGVRDYECVRREPCLVSGQDSYLLEFLAKQGGRRWRVRMVFTRTDSNTVLRLCLSAPAEKADSAVMSALQDSFEVLNPEPDQPKNGKTDHLSLPLPKGSAQTTPNATPKPRVKRKKKVKLY